MISFYKSSALFVCLFILGLVASAHAFSTTLYISDEIYVPVRKGQGNQFQILHRGLPSGTEVELIETDDEWSEIRTNSGITGWVRNQYLDKMPPAKLRLQRANQRVQTLEKELNAIEALQGGSQALNNELRSQLESTQATLKSTENELAEIKTISASALESYQQLQEIAKKMQLLQTENDVLRSENDSLRLGERTRFFFYGILALFLGVIVSWMAPRLRRQKSSEGWLN